MFIAELDHPEFGGFDLSIAAHRHHGRLALPDRGDAPRASAEMHMGEVTIAYGMTETSPVSFQSSTDDPLERRVATVGRIQPHLEVKIVDARRPHRAARHARRAVHARLFGDARLLGRRGAHRARRSTPPRWMHTGDLATIDAEGYCNIVGRIKDMVIRGGENIYPREIEEFLYRHPKVQDVQVLRRARPRSTARSCAPGHHAQGRA